MSRRYSGLGYLDNFIDADLDTTVPLPNPLLGGGPLAIGALYTVVDNNGAAGTTHITVSGPIAGVTSGSGTISSNYGRLVYRWAGATFVQVG